MDTPAALGKPAAPAPRRVLVTGATGYVGRNLTAALVKSGWVVHAAVRAADAVLPSGVLRHALDGSYAAIDAAVRHSRPDVVLHTASSVLVSHGAEDIPELINSNVTFPTQLLEAMIAHGVTRFVDTGTSWQHFNPEAAYSPTNLYAATKQAFQDICQFYVEAHDLSAIQLKLFDVYGPHDQRSKIVPLLLQIAHSGETIAMSGGAQRMDMVFIDDVVAAYIAAANRLMPADQARFESYTVRGGDVFTLRQIVEELQTQIGRPLNIEWGGRAYRDREVMEPWSQHRPLPGWLPHVSLPEGLRRVVSAANLQCL